MKNLMKTVAATAALTLVGTAAMADAKFEDFDVNAAVLDPMTDMNRDGEVTIDEIIAMNEAAFDIDGDGVINAAERGEAEVFLENELG